MQEFEIITLSPDDWARYRQIRLEALQTDQRAFLTTYTSAYQRPPEAWQKQLAEAERGEISWLRFAQVDGRLVGLAGAFTLNEPGSAEIVQVYVSPGWRGRGIARALIEAILAVLAQKGIRTATLTVNAGQSAAVALYQKLGFTITAQMEAVMGDGGRYPEYKMEKKVSNQ
jgi:ribosomal protein S18 acetylase RimI-like enzyme